MADRLRDYQELVQVKTSLSLEVATYRALLEGESNPEILILTERIENIPQELGSTSYRYGHSVLQRENERNLFARQKAPFSHSPLRRPHLPAQPAVGSAAGRGFLGSEYSSRTTTRQETTYEKTANLHEKTAESQSNFRTFSPTHNLLRDADAPAKTFPERPRSAGMKDASAREAREPAVAQKPYQERRNDVSAGASKNTWSSERTVTVGKKTEANATREQDRNRPGTVQTKREEKMFDSKEKASEERNLRWEELTKLDKEARKRESQQLREQGRGKESAQEKSEREREVPISLEVSRESVPQVAPKGLQTPPQEDPRDGTGRGVETREARVRLGPGDTAGLPKGESTTETIAENIVSSILKQFTQSPDTEASANAFPDTKVTYMDRKELPGDRKTKTEIVVESRLTEEVDVSDEAGLDYLLSKDVKEVDLKGKSAERMIGDIINLGLKGREGKARVVNVEIIEEPVSYVSGEKAEEFSTPFEVEEVDDVSPGSKGLVEEEEGYRGADSTFSGNRHKKTKWPQENVTHVEEVMEAGDSEGGEQSYFVSTPDEHPGAQDRDEGSVYGQIHIEEESTIRYSWQDEIVPGTRRRVKRDDGSGETVVKPPDVVEPSLGEDVGHTHWQEQARSGEFHAEPTVIEKEIKIPHEFHTSLKGAFKEPRHQMVEVIGQLEESLPERVKEELSALTREGQGGPENVSVDVKKVHTSSGRAVTLVAEVNLSKTVDANQLDLEELSKDEAGEIEKVVESVVRDSLARRPSPAPGSPGAESAEEAPAAGLRFRRWATQELYRPYSEEDAAGRASPSSEPATSPGPVSATVEVTSPTGFAQSHVLEDVSRSAKRVQIGPAGIWRTEHVSREGPTAQVVEVSGEGDPRTEAAAHGAPDRGAWRDGGSGKAWVAGASFQGSAGDGHQVPGEKGKEQAEFDRTVQLHRTVDQRSVISDEKKVALLYLDNPEEDSEGHWF
uniref:IF rod domain-containing protein n=1 Tax=Ursus americanus TaxID=9643 RepID=A0A452QD07_URSAM